MSKKTTNSDDSAYRAAREHHAAGRLRDAEAAYRVLLERDPGHANAWHMLGVLASQEGRNEEAVTLVQRAVDLHPKEAGFHSELGEMYRRIGKLEDAARCCKQAIALQPYHADGYYNLGVVYQQQGALHDAIGCYDQALKLQPANANAWHNLGNALRQSGRVKESLGAYAKALAVDPNHTWAHGNLGVAYVALQQWDDAIACFKRVIALQPNEALAYSNLGNALRNKSQLGEAVEAYRQAARLAPNHALTFTNLAVLLESTGRVPEAIGAFRRALDLAPRRIESYQNLGQALENAGRMEEAAVIFRQGLALDTELGGMAAPDVRFHMAAVAGVAVPGGPPADYIAKLFDKQSDDFDRHLVKTLQYQGPALIVEALSRAVLQAGDRARDFGDLLDLGCGTGLCGAVCRPYCKRLVGVDLSPRMIEKAQLRGIYEELVVGDLLEALRARPQAFDTVIAGDVLVYLGDLTPLFAAVAGALRPAGIFAYTVEAWDNDGYALRATQRYAHALSYLRHLAADHGFTEVSAERAMIRNEKTLPVEGWMVVVRRNHPAI